MRFILTISLLLLSITALATPTLTSNIVGLQDAALVNAKLRLKLNQTIAPDKLTLPNIYTYFKEAPKQIQEAIKPFGYFQASIYPRLQHEGQNWTATYQVDPGPRLKVTAFNLHLSGPGKTNTRLQHYTAHLKQQEGSSFTSQRYENNQLNLLTYAEQQGYLKAKYITDQILIDLEAYTCVINMELHTGKKYYFGHTHFSTTPLDNAFLRRYLNFKPGDTFSNQTLLNLQQALLESGYFASVSIAPQIDDAVNQQVPINIDFKMNHRKFYRIGLGFGTGAGARATLGVDWRWVNKHGQRFKTQIQTSQVNTNFAAQYLFPGHRPSIDQYALNASRFYITPPHGNSIGTKVGASYATKIGNWQTTIDAGWLYERYRFNTHEHYQTAHIYLPTLNLKLIQSNSLLNPTQGYSISLTTKASEKTMGSSVTFAQGDLTYKQLIPFGRNLRFYLQSEFGYTTVKNRATLPMSLQFYTGGFTSVRGYKDQSLGPGRYLRVLDPELRQRIKGNWWATVFTDNGDASNRFNLVMKNSVGLGLIWESPIGPVKLSLAKARSLRGQPLRVQFSIGPDL